MPSESEEPAESGKVNSDSSVEGGRYDENDSLVNDVQPSLDIVPTCIP